MDACVCQRTRKMVALLKSIWHHHIVTYPPCGAVNYLKINLPVCAFDSRAQGLSPPLARQRSSRPPPSPSCGVCALSSHLFWASDSFRYNVWTHQPGSQEESHAEFFFLLFFLPLPSAVLALIFIARGIQPFLSLVIHEIEFCVSTT